MHGHTMMLSSIKLSTLTSRYSTACVYNIKPNQTTTLTSINSPPLSPVSTAHHSHQYQQPTTLTSINSPPLSPVSTAHHSHQYQQPTTLTSINSPPLLLVSTAHHSHQYQQPTTLTSINRHLGDISHACNKCLVSSQFSSQFSIYNCVYVLSVGTG